MGHLEWELLSMFLDSYNSGNFADKEKIRKNVRMEKTGQNVKGKDQRCYRPEEKRTHINEEKGQYYMECQWKRYLLSGNK